MGKSIKVLVIDDSAFDRRTITKLLESIPDVEVVGTACDGNEGLKQATRLKPDLITLDLEMPIMDGFTFLRIIMGMFPVPIPIIVISSRSENDNVFKAMELGAVDFIPKPNHTPSITLFNIQDELTMKIKMLPHLKMDKVVKGILKPLQKSYPQEEIRRTNTEIGFDVIAIGSSTGGPPAISAILPYLTEEFPIVVVISQHMPPGFTKPFAERLDKICKMRVREAGNDEEVKPGDILIAPGGYHLAFKNKNKTILTQLLEKREQDRYVPSIDVMFSSSAQIWGERILAVILTGMGQDGREGIIKIKEKGGYVIAESEETSIVFGMPEAAITTGMVDEITPLYDIGPLIAKRCIAGMLKRA